MSCAYLAFTERGLALAQQLAAVCPGPVARCGAGGPGLDEWTAAQSAASDALIYIGAVGIAVRAIAPYCRSKAADPAVVVLDECGRFAVPLLSGHLGGANALARRAVRCRSSQPPPICTAFLRWTSGPNGKAALWPSRSVSSGSAAHCWRESACILPRIGPYRVRCPLVCSLQLTAALILR